MRTARLRERLSLVRSASKRRSRNSIYMSVVVIDGNMPTDYDSCWYLDCKCWKECSVNGKQYNCPLRPLPEKHGRLIDADDMERFMSDTVQGDIRQYPYSDTLWDMAFKWIDSRPTIVEAKGE